MEDGGPSSSDVEGQDVVDVDDDPLEGASSVTGSELSVASPSHHRRQDGQIASSTLEMTDRIDKRAPKRTKKRVTPAKKKTLPVKKKKKIAAATASSTSTTTTATASKTTDVRHHLETADNGDSGGSSSCGLEASVEQVAERFAQGCECRDGESCFTDINPESAYRHRLNIAELTRSEHDMYLMGVTMASLSNPEETARRTERKRLHTQYVFQVFRLSHVLYALLYRPGRRRRRKMDAQQPKTAVVAPVKAVHGRHRRVN